jgi:hypothetical protein
MATIKLTQDFKEFLRLLHSEQIEYLLIGGYAVGLYGVPRPTKDLDVWVSMAVANLDRLIGVLEKFGFATGSITREMFLQQQTVFRMGVPPNRLEILTRLSGVEFADCYLRRRIMTVDDIDVSVIDLDDLLKNKSAAARPQDVADVGKLTKRRSS